MVINSLLLILKDTLPVFVLMAFLAHLQLLNMQRIVLALVLILVITCSVLLFSSSIHQWWEGFGMDVLRATLNAWCLPAIFMLIRNGVQLKTGRSSDSATHSSIWVLVALCSVTAPSSINYIIYFSGLWQSQAISSSFFIGLAMGLGISLSVSVLLYLMLDGIKRVRLSLLLLTMFIAGQIAGIASMLEQINWLEDPFRLWDSNFLLAENNEYGQLLHILVGYEATPTQYYLIFYVFSLAVLAGLLWRISQKPMAQVSGVSK